jgi:hypothetical protein
MQQRQVVFISYAWPADAADCTRLQARLLRLVQDLDKAGIEVLLDICHLTLGKNINEFMSQGISSSEAVLWIGTPRLKERIVFKDSGDPANNATVEFVHIQTKLVSLPPTSPRQFLLPLWFSGNTLSDAFPSLYNYPTVGKDLPCIDFHDQHEYYCQLPLLASAILWGNNAAFPVSFKSKYMEYCVKVKRLQDGITKGSVQAYLFQSDKLIKEQQSHDEAEVHRLLALIPESTRGTWKVQKRPNREHYERKWTNTRKTWLLLT